MVKIIFSDFDDTLLYYHNGDRQFSSYQLEILKKLRESGIKFCIISGRCVSFFFQFSELLPFVDYIIGSNGGCIYDVKLQKFIYQNSILDDDYQFIMKYAIEKNYSILLNHLDKQYLLDLENKNVDVSCEQVILSFPEENLSEVLESFGRKKHIIINNMTRRNGYCSIDINHIDTSKGKTVCWLCRFLKIDLHDTVAFGNEENDISMFSVVGKSVAVGNSSDKIKQNSDDVSLNCENNGVFKYIEDNILR